MMSLDNFQFDVASNPGIGLVFTEQERRAACFQLLLLPKYLRKTSTFLSNARKVSEGTVRRWCQQVESLVDEDSAKLQEFGVSPERVERLKEAIADPHRENEEGETVAIRQKPKELTPEERSKFWQDIKNAAIFDQRSDGIRYLNQTVSVTSIGMGSSLKPSGRMSASTTSSKRAIYRINSPEGNSKISITG